MKMKLLCLVAALCPLSAVAGLVHSDTSDLGVVGDDLALALRGIDGDIWDQDDGTNYEKFDAGTHLFERGGVDWYKSDLSLLFGGGEVAMWGIYTEATFSNSLHVNYEGNRTRVVGSKEAAFTTQTSVFTPDGDPGSPVRLELFVDTTNSGPYSSLYNVVFATGTYNDQNYGLILFDDSYPSLDNHDDFIGLVRFNAAVPEPSAVLGAITAGILSLLILRPRSRRNAA